MEEDWSSANHFRNFLRQKKVLCVSCKMQILRFYFVEQIFWYRLLCFMFFLLPASNNGQMENIVGWLLFLHFPHWLCMQLICNETNYVGTAWWLWWGGISQIKHAWTRYMYRLLPVNTNCIHLWTVLPGRWEGNYFYWNMQSCISYLKKNEERI